MMIHKILIANRGEIAIRVARTAARMGIETVAVYTADDAQSLHIKHADQAQMLLGSGIAGYLDIADIVRIATDAGCDAIHPGYGFLSERADFADACKTSGLVFVGPDGATLAMQGDKVAARDLANGAGVPVVRGGDLLNDANDARAFFETCGGAPVMIKAVNGGGGRGMRVVQDAEQITVAFATCQAEALAAFGSNALYSEQFLDAVRHIEIQIVGDGTDVVHLWERDCSIQRRNQKIVELAPAPNLDPRMRADLLAAALKIGQACSLKGVATVEFLVQTGAAPEFHFIETNPRIQVEHTITEEITGLDIVELQLQIAAGRTLADIGITQQTLGPPTGVAVQVRVNTETFAPDGQVMPTGGLLQAFQPPSGPGVRVDTYGYQGYETNPRFDSLLAKLIVHEKSGDLAALFAKTERALSEFQIAGPDTNIGFLRDLLRWPQLGNWDVTVGAAAEQIKALSAKAPMPTKNRFFEAKAMTTDVAPDTPVFADGTDIITVPMQASLVSVDVVGGDHFETGDVLAIVEAMKMQHVVTAPASGTVHHVLYAAGDVVAAGTGLIAYHVDADQGGVTQNKTALDPDAIRPDLQALHDRLALTLDENRPKAVARRRSRGQRTARENIADLCDGGTFHEYGQLVFAGQRRKHDHDALMAASPADGIITGLGQVNAASAHATQVAVLAYDASVMAGTQGMFGHKKTDRMLEVARKQNLPVVFFTEGGGGRPNDDDFNDTMASGLNVTTFYEFARLQGRAPRIAVNSGFCFAGNAAIFGAGDIKIATRDSWIGLGGPAMIEAGGLGTFSPKDIGPAPMQAAIGLVDLLAEDEADATRLTKQALSYFQGPVTEWDAPDQRLLRHAVPENRKRVYGMRAVIDLLADQGSVLELGDQHGPGMITGFLRIQGQPMGVIANNPHHLGGALDADASTKAARFLGLCSRFAMPVLSLCDTPGFMVGPESERAGGVQAACDLLGAGALLQAPMFFVCLRKGYGIGAQAMAGGSLVTPVFTLSWPSGEFGPMGLEGAVTLGYKHELDAEADPEKRKALFDDLVAQAYRQGSALNVAAFQEIDAVIDPADTRGWIAKGLALTLTADQ